MLEVPPAPGEPWHSFTFCPREASPWSAEQEGHEAGESLNALCEVQMSRVTADDSKTTRSPLASSQGTTEEEGTGTPSWSLDPV
ncbi:hypothetical protein EYF80_045012 [Liparis tanakae]|uniref:Uncharacterized protein n=1 Tax=Liparis tanakae TaxID=230148 RepID=A0A4Z2FVD5_9TELE|nr:hypothetical protein EYF80_045012 [Liparis tanakae]